MPEERRDDQQDEQPAREPSEHSADPKVEDLALPEEHGQDVKGGVGGMGAGKVQMQDFSF